MNPIEKVVMPLKEDAKNKAEAYARDIIGKVKSDLEKVGWDVKKTAPYPSSSDSSWGGRFAFQFALNRYYLFAKLTTWVNSTQGIHDPCPVTLNLKACTAFIREARENAALQYDAFVLKLNKKIGPVKSALLQGNHVWGHSFLIVQTKTGMQIWKTQTIINVSKFGKVFNQYPSRRVKSVR